MITTKQREYILALLKKKGVAISNERFHMDHPHHKLLPHFGEGAEGMLIEDCIRELTMTEASQAIEFLLGNEVTLTYSDGTKETFNARSRSKRMDESTDGPMWDCVD